jgi:hypothetical protein
MLNVVLIMVKEMINSLKEIMIVSNSANKMRYIDNKIMMMNLIIILIKIVILIMKKIVVVVMMKKVHLMMLSDYLFK